MFRKMLTIALCLLLLFCVGCANVAEESSTAENSHSQESTGETTFPTEEIFETETSGTEEVTESPTETPSEVLPAPVDAENPVVEAFAGTYSRGVETINYSIPQIQCESTYAQAINEEFSGFYYNYINEEGYYGGNKSFDWYINGDVLSVVVYHFDNDFDHQYTVPGSDSEWDFRHSIYNIHMSDGSPVTNEEILQLAGVSVEDFRARAQKILGNEYIIKSLPPASSEFIYNDLLEDGKADWMYEYFCKSVSDENLDLIEVFLGENGTLYFMGLRYYTAGGFEYATPLFDYFADFEVSPYYEVFFENIP